MENSETELSRLASLVTLFGALLTVIYSNPAVGYDVWDLLVAASVIAVCWRLRMSHEPGDIHLHVSRAAFSLASMLITMTALQFWPTVFDCINRSFFEIFDGQFVVAVLFFLVSPFVLPARAKR